MALFYSFVSLAEIYFVSLDLVDNIDKLSTVFYNKISKALQSGPPPDKLHAISMTDAQP